MSFIYNKSQVPTSLIYGYIYLTIFVPFALSPVTVDFVWSLQELFGVDLALLAPFRILSLPQVRRIKEEVKFLSPTIRPVDILCMDYTNC